MNKNGKKVPTSPYDTFTMIVKSEIGVECVKEFRFHQGRMWRFDYAIPDHKVALEVEGGVWTGGRHTRPRGFLNDIEKYNTAATDGWIVVRTTPELLMSSRTLDMLRNLIQQRTVESK